MIAVMINLTGGALNFIAAVLKRKCVSTTTHWKKKGMNIKKNVTDFEIRLLKSGFKKTKKKL